MAGFGVKMPVVRCRYLIRIALIAAAAAVSSGVTIVAAEASLFLIFDRTRAPVGTAISAHTGGNGAFGANSPGALPMFLVPAQQADRITSETDPALVPLGSLIVDGEGNGSTTFTVPDVPAGRYRVMIHCEACAQFSAGRTMLVAGPFERPFVVLAGAALPSPSAQGPDAPSGSSRTVLVWLSAGLVLAAVAALTWFAVRPRRSGRP